jgi:hypothetical protein
MKIKNKALLLALAMTLGVFSINAQTQPNSSDLIKKLEEAAGGWDNLWKQKDVQFDYLYHYFGPDIKDVSVERYILKENTLMQSILRIR